MSKYSVNEQELLKAKVLLGHVNRKIENVISIIDKACAELQGQKGFGIESEKMTLNIRKQVLQRQMENLNSIKNYLQTVIDDTKLTSENARKILNNENVEITPTPIPSLAPTQTPSKKEEMSNKVVITEGGAPRYPQLAYTQQGLEPPANGDIWGNYVYHRDGSKNSVAFRNPSGEVACTYYTLRRLNEQGLSYPCTGGPGDGGDWYGYFDKDSNLYHYDGNNALYDLVHALTLPQENIVVSFEYNPAWDGNSNMYYQDYGHVLLIDKIYEENGVYMVEYSDNYNSDKNHYVYGLNDTNYTQYKTLGAFMHHYNKYNGNINGVVVMGAGYR